MNSNENEKVKKVSEESLKLNEAQIKLNLGSSYMKSTGWLNVDINEGENVDISVYARNGTTF